MPNCSVSNVEWETLGKELTPYETPVSFNMSTNETMYFTLLNNQTVYFYFYLSMSSGVVAPSVMISVYNAYTMNLVSSLTSANMIIETNIDLPAGQYIVCMRSLKGAYTGTAKADYYGYSRTVTLFPGVGESGQSVGFELKTEPRRKACDKPMRWELMEGKIPPGLVLEEYSGLLHGKLPWLDCLDDPEDPFKDIPSANMFYTTAVEDIDTVEPWGRRWRFKLRISMVDQPEHYEEEWFCVAIYNDWSRSEKKFYQIYDNGNALGDLIQPADKPYSFGLCPPNPCEIDKSIDHVIDLDIGEWDGVTKEDNVMVIEIPDISTVNPKSTLKNNNKYTVYSRINGLNNKQEVEIEDDGEMVVLAYGVHRSTIEMDRDVIEVSSMYAPPSAKGYVHETIMFEVDDYDHFLTFRQWAKHNSSKLDPDDTSTRLFSDFVAAKPNVKYEYMYYHPKQGFEWDPEGTKDISDRPMNFIYIYYDPDDLPEVAYVEELITTQKQKGPWDGEGLIGESMEVEIV